MALFPKTKAFKGTNRYGGSAGNSSSNNKPGPGNSDYLAGFTGERASRQAGGQTMGQQQRGVPLYQAGIEGDGGLAWDNSAAAALRPPSRGKIAH